MPLKDIWKLQSVFFFFDVNASATSNQPVEHPVLNAFHPTRMRLCVEYHAFREVRALCGQQVQQASWAPVPTSMMFVDV